MNLTTFKTLLLREYWENRSFVMAPGIISAVILFSLLVAIITGQNLMVGMGDMHYEIDAELTSFSGKGSEEMSMVFKAFQYALFMAPLALGLFFVMFFYVLGSLYNERKDRSILFWKSMPVSDTQTVLSKVFSALITAPTLTATIAVFTQIVGLILISIFIMLNGGSAWNIVWVNSSLITVIFNDFAALIVTALWTAPILGWLWLVSAFAKRAAFLIAVFVPLGIIMIEGMIMHSARFAEMIGEHMAGYGNIAEAVFKQGHPFSVFSSSEIWIGLLITAVFIAAAIYIRRFRDDSY